MVTVYWRKCQVDWHLLGIVLNHDILYALTVTKHIMRPPDTLTHARYIEVVAEKIRGLYRPVPMDPPSSA
jgi:hypothetical protein